MTQQREETSDLLATVEEIREREYPELDRELVNEILRVQHQHAGDRAEARKLTEQLINQWVSRNAAPEGPV